MSSNAEPSDGSSRESRGLRLDLLIAVCALLISSLASAASWWQTRLLSEQTHILEQQLGAQVWPYVGVSMDIDSTAVTVNLNNSGLGPAVVRSETALVEGVPQTSMIGVLHAVLGPDLRTRKPRGERIGLAFNGGSPGTVLRAGESVALMRMTSKTYALPFALTKKRVTYRVCYCAIIPGQCWSTDSATNADPQPLSGCTAIAKDLMHSSPVAELNAKTF